MNTTTPSVTILPIREKQSSNDYPYGRLRTTAYFSIEFVPGKGFRSVFQTVNPKNGRLNAEKKSTYSHFAYLVLNTENGHFETRKFGIGGFEDINKLSKFMLANQVALGLTKEMVIDLCCTIVTTIRIASRWINADAENALPLIEKAFKTALSGFKTGVCNWEELFIDVDAIENLAAKKNSQAAETAPGFISTGPVSLMSMIK